MQASATPCTLQRWQEMGKSCVGVRQKRAEKSCVQAEPQDKRWVAMSNFRKPVGNENTEKDKNTENVRSEEDGVLFIIPVRIYGKFFQALVDSGASRSFVSPRVVETAQLRWEPHDTFLELGNGERILSRGRVTDVPVVNGNHCTKCNLTVTSLLHQVDLLLGISWLKKVNSLIDWQAGAMYLLSSDRQFIMLTGRWLKSSCKINNSHCNIFR